MRGSKREETDEFGGFPPDREKKATGGMSKTNINWGLKNTKLTALRCKGAIISVSTKKKKTKTRSNQSKLKEGEGKNYLYRKSGKKTEAREKKHRNLNFTWGENQGDQVAEEQ